MTDAQIQAQHLDHPEFSTTLSASERGLVTCSNMTTLSDISLNVDEFTAIIVPHPSRPLTISYRQLVAQVSSFQRKLAALGLSAGSAVSIALPNSYEFIVAFLATSWQRGIAAPLNAAYTQEEFEFYIDDLSSAVTLVPRGAVQQDAAAVRAARKHNAAIAECYWDGHLGEIILDVKDHGKLRGMTSQRLATAQTDDVALVLHTSGTTGRPKAVCESGSPEHQAHDCRCL